MTMSILKHIKQINKPSKSLKHEWPSVYLILKAQALALSQHLR